MLDLQVPPPATRDELHPPPGWWAAVPASLWTSCLTDGAKCLYAHLLAYGGRDGAAWPSEARLARELRCSPRTVQRRLDELEECGWLRRQRVGMPAHNVYLLLVAPFARSSDTRDAPRCDTGVAQDATPVSRHEATPVSHEQHPLEQDPGNNSQAPPAPPPAPDPVVVAALRAEGIAAKAAASLSTTFDTARIRRQLAWLPHRDIKRNRAGALLRAIEEDWPAPQGAPPLALSPRELDKRAESAVNAWWLEEEAAGRTPTQDQADQRFAALRAELARQAGGAYAGL